MLVKSTNANLDVASVSRVQSVYMGSLNRYPLHKPLSSNVPIRIFRIQGSFAPSLVVADSEEAVSFFSLARWASKRPLIESTVVSNPRLPKKSVGAGGCFCAERIFCANLEWPFPGALGPSSDVPGFRGRPAKLSPEGGKFQVVQSKEENEIYIPSLIRRRRPSRGDSVIRMAASLASGVAKST